MELKKAIIVSLVLVAVSIATTLLITIINDSLFLEPMRENQFRHMFEAGEVPKPPYNNGPPIVELETTWPNSAIIFYFSALSCYWILLGCFVAIIYPTFPKKAFFVIPVVSNVMSLTTFIVGYVALCLGGNLAVSSYMHKRSKKKGQKGSEPN